jgi:hypothetical protein
VRPFQYSGRATNLFSRYRYRTVFHFKNACQADDLLVDTLQNRSRSQRLVVVNMTSPSAYDMF